MYIGLKSLQTATSFQPWNPLSLAAFLAFSGYHTKNQINLQAATQLLIHWAGLTPTEATWEFADEIALRFPQFDLEDKVHLKKGQLLQANI